MAYTGHQVTHSFKVASQVGAYLPVFHSATDGETVVPAASVNADVVGLTRATVGTHGIADAIVVGGVAKAIAAASLGAGARVGIGSTNGALSPLTLSGAGAASQVAEFQVGRALHPAAAGGTFSVLLDPGQFI